MIIIIIEENYDKEMKFFVEKMVMASYKQYRQDYLITIEKNGRKKLTKRIKVFINDGKIFDFEIKADGSDIYKKLHHNIFKKLLKCVQESMCENGGYL